MLARHISGASNREIARIERIDRETVNRILTQQEVVQMITHYRSRLLNMVPKAIGVYDEALGSDDLRIAATAATKLLEGFQVLPKGGMEQTPSKPDRRQQKLLMLGSVMDMMPQKSCRYAVPVPPELSDVEEEVKKRM